MTHPARRKVYADYSIACPRCGESAANLTRAEAFDFTREHRSRHGNADALERAQTAYYETPDALGARMRLTIGIAHDDEPQQVNVRKRRR